MSDVILVWLATYAVKSSAILSTAWIATRLLRSTSAAMRHACWSAAIVLVVALPFATVAVPDVSVAVAWVPSQGSTSRPEMSAGSRTMTPFSNSVSAGAANGVSPSSIEAPGDDRRGRGWSSVLLLVWMLGTSVLLIRVLRDSFLARRLCRRADRVELPRVRRMLEELIGTRSGRIDVRTSLIETPLVAGAVDPIILLPSSVEGWDRETLRSVLAHEVAHILQYDCLTQMLARLMCAVQWFNPLAWVGARSLAAEAERACDDAVLRTGVSDASYADVLIGFARASGASPGPAFLAQMARPGRELTLRIEAVLNRGLIRARPSPAAGSTLAAASLAVMIPLASVQFRPIASPAAARTVPALPALPPQLGVEPDRLGDSVSSPLSERLSLSDETWRLARQNLSSVLNGPDALLAERLAAALDHVPTMPWDLVGERAAWALASARDRRLVEPIIARLSSSNWREVGYAAWALGVAGDPRGVEPLILLLRHDVWRVRAVAAAALAQLGDQRARDAMLVALNDAAWQVRAEAVHLLAGAPDSTARAAIRSRLSDRHIAVRLAAESVLTGR